MSQDTIILSAAGGWPSNTTGASGPIKKELTTNKQNIITLNFPDTGVKNYAEWGIWMPAQLGITSNGNWAAKIYWTADSSSTSSVQWGVQSILAQDNTSLDIAWGTGATALSANTSTNLQLHITPELITSVILGATVGQWAQVRVWRDSGAAGDTLGATAMLLAVYLFPPTL
jgi:hypothetical protein